MENNNPDGKAEFHNGSATQGGSNFGQGSEGLGKESLKQGEDAGKGSTYENEQGWNNEALRMEDVKPKPGEEDKK